MRLAVDEIYIYNNDRSNARADHDLPDEVYRLIMYHVPFWRVESSFNRSCPGMKEMTTGKRVKAHKNFFLEWVRDLI